MDVPSAAHRPPGLVLGLAERLLYAGQLDTVYRDLYVTRAREVLAPALSLDQFRRLRDSEATLERLLRDSRLAIERHEWARVRELSARGQALGLALGARAPELATGRRVYGTVAVAFDPFSPGWDVALAQRGQNVVATRDALLQALDALSATDPAWHGLYAARRNHFAALQLAGAAGADTAAAGISPALVAREALQAIEQRDLVRVERLAALMTETTVSARGAVSAVRRESGSGRCPVDLALPFPPNAVVRARALGLAPFDLPGPRQSLQSLIDFMYRHARQPDFHARHDRHDRIMELYEVVQTTQASQRTAEVFREFVELFIRHSYVNSGGARYLPPALPEAMLVEDFPEGAGPVPVGPLLEALGLRRRHGLARVEVERALLDRGHAVLRDGLGLDSVEFKLVCLPFDAYLRIGFRVGWGHEQRWTHFDGYQVMDGAEVRALVGGDVRYGGLSDMVSISPLDERGGVMVRFAVVRRARLVARWP